MGQVNVNVGDARLFGSDRREYGVSAAARRTHLSRKLQEGCCVASDWGTGELPQVDSAHGTSSSRPAIELLPGHSQCGGGGHQRDKGKDDLEGIHCYPNICGTHQRRLSVTACYVVNSGDNCACGARRRSGYRYRKSVTDSTNAQSAAQTSAPTAAVFRSDMKVELVRSSANDSDVLFAARVSTQGEQSLEAAAAGDEATSRDRGLINYLMRDRHGSPFEHNSMTFYVQAPIFVFREFMRHRIASYNEESGRYRELDAVFYVPGLERNLVQVGKPGAYDFLPGSPEQTVLVGSEVRAVATEAFASYQRMLEAGVAREVARIVLPLTIYSSMYVTMNARALMNFLSLRTKREGTHFPSFPQREIEMCAEQMEEHFAQLMPLTYAAFNENGRVAP